MFPCVCSSIVGTVYPVYQSFKAVEAPLRSHPRRDAQWLTYWAVYSSFSLLEQHASKLLTWCAPEADCRPWSSPRSCR